MPVSHFKGKTVQVNYHNCRVGLHPVAEIETFTCEPQAQQTGGGGGSGQRDQVLDVHVSASAVRQYQRGPHGGALPGDALHRIQGPASEHDFDVFL